MFRFFYNFYRVGNVQEYDCGHNNLGVTRGRGDFFHVTTQVQGGNASCFFGATVGPGDANGRAVAREGLGCVFFYYPHHCNSADGAVQPRVGIFFYVSCGNQFANDTK